MKICVPTMGEGGMQEAICQHFGRAPTFTMVDLDNGDIKVLPNVSEHIRPAHRDHLRRRRAGDDCGRPGTQSSLSL